VKVRFEVTVEDIVATERYFDLYDPERRRARNATMKTAWGVLISIGAYGVFSSDRSNLKQVIVTVVAPLLILIACFVYIFTRQVRMPYSKKDVETLTGPYEAEIVDDGISFTTRFARATHFWAHIDKLVLEGPRAFLLVDRPQRSAFVISRRTVSEGDFDSFVDALRQRIETSKRDSKS
jgi:hypothetical protein